jgi:hypothetical protein
MPRGKNPSVILLGAIGFVVLGGALSARGDDLDRSTEGHEVRVRADSPFSTLPPGGCVPFRVTIRNDGDSSGTWRMTFQSSSNMSNLGASIFEQDCPVAANSSATFDLLVPLPKASNTPGYNTTLQVGVAGPGFENAGAGREFFGYFYQNNATARSPYTIIGQNLLGPIGLGPLETLYKDGGQEFYGSEVDPAALPSDWRAYSGVASILLKDTEWLDLSPAQHDAICDYVAQGGQLTLFTTQGMQAAELQLPGPNGQPGAYGFGSIEVKPEQTQPPTAETLSLTLNFSPAADAQKIDQNFSTWDLRQSLGTIAVSAVFILSFVILFGSVVGPVNLFVFARGKNRFRLFWTTPLISVVASVALIAGILLTDGIGGTGKQMVVIYNLPEVNREVVIQEQVARTALLFSNRWLNTQDYLITPISADSIDGAMYHHGEYAFRGTHTDLDDSPDTYFQKGNELSGNWFRSRAITGQYLQAVLPSRSCLTVLNPNYFIAPTASLSPFPRTPTPPVVLSSFPTTLTKVFLLDASGHYWTCDNLEPGRQQTCAPASVADFNVFWNAASANAGGKLRPALNGARNRPGYFYATGLPPANDTLTTLGEIRWQVTTGLYLGPWVASPTPETGP